MVGDGAQIGHGSADVPNQACPEHLSQGLVVVGKDAHLPADVSIGRNARIGAHVRHENFSGDVPSGGVVHGPETEH
jgi:glucose-1-phosphate adenylyltransferase